MVPDRTYLELRGARRLSPNVPRHRIYQLLPSSWVCERCGIRWDGRAPRKGIQYQEQLEDGHLRCYGKDPE